MKIKHRTHLLSQKARLAILFLYICGLLAASWYLHDAIIPPSGSEGIWFYASLASLLLGSLLITPFYSRPVDTAAYSVASIITLLAVNVWSLEFTTVPDRIIWTFALIYATATLWSAVFAIIFFNSIFEEKLNIGKFSYSTSRLLGSPRIIFSIVFAFAVYTFHRDSMKEIIVLCLIGLIYIILAPLETFWRFVSKRMGGKEITEDVNYIGKIVAHNAPNLLLINIDLNIDQDQNIEFGDPILVRNEHNKLGVAVALDYIGFSGGRWLRLYYLNETSLGNFHQICDSDAPSGLAYKLNMQGMSVDTKDKINEVKKSLLGFVSVGSTSEILKINLVRSDMSIQQGSVIELTQNGRKIDYQVVNGITQEEQLRQKNTHGYVQVRARKIGFWNQDTRKYIIDQRLPNPNVEVRVKSTDLVKSSLEGIGYLYNTSNEIRVDLNKLVTRNAAILGVLGSGKSTLAIELAERMIDSGIKVICIDPTPQYSKELDHFINDNGDSTVKRSDSESNFKENLKSYLEQFLDDNSKLKIIDPTSYEISKQNSSSDYLLPSEITFLVTSTLLDLMKSDDMSDIAKCCIIYDEAHLIIPEWNSAINSADKNAALNTAKTILQGRKFGLGSIIVTQRTAHVSKSILNQCNTVFAFRIYDNTAIEFLENYFGKEHASSLSTLEDQNAIIYGMASSSQVPVHIRLNKRGNFLRMFRFNKVGHVL